MAIEVELRGPLQDGDYDNLKSILIERGEFLREERRFLIAYDDGSPGGVKDPLTDVRLRMTNGQLELIVKKGSTLKSQREEQALMLPEQDMAAAMRLMALLGYVRGLAAYRHIERYNLDGVEFALVAVHVCDGRPVPSEETLHSRFFEAERCCQPGEEDTVLQELEATLFLLGLQVHTYESWSNFMDVMNEGANMDFTYEEHKDAIVDMFQ